MLLSELLQQPLKDDIEITRVVDDSRQAQDGDVFIFDGQIMPGGQKFLKEALQKGAICVSDIEMENVIQVLNPGQVLSRWAKIKFPKQPQTVVGVTGTNGKTSVAWFYQDLMSKCGYKSACMGTMGVKLKDKGIQYTGYTTPNALTLHENLQGLAEKSVSHLVMEVSSHALALHRADGVEFTAAAFTNITPDHRDFHGSMEHYMAAKARLFSEVLPEGAKAILNASKPECWPLASICKQRDIKVLSSGMGNCELVVRPIEMDAQGMSLDIAYDKYKKQVRVPLLGSFQAENIAYALGLAMESGVSFQQLIDVLPDIVSVPGRMEVVKTEDDQPTVVVDYAHTPDALSNALKAVRIQTKGRLFVVFGCGGNRDEAKRAKMGEIAQELAEVVIITDDNPRAENPENIRAQIQAACQSGINVGDRAQAIEKAIDMAASDDVILIAGKGHETEQIVGNETLHFDDREMAQKFLQKK